MDDFSVPDDAIGKDIGVSRSKILNGAIEGIISLDQARHELYLKIDNRMHLE